MRCSIYAAALAAAFAAAAPASSQRSGLSAEGFQAYLPRLRGEALAAGVSRRTVDTIFPALEYSARTVELDQAQPGGVSGATPTPPFAPYRARHVTPALINGGARRYAANCPPRGRAAALWRHSIVLVAIWGPRPATARHRPFSM